MPIYPNLPHSRPIHCPIKLSSDPARSLYSCFQYEIHTVGHVEELLDYELREFIRYHK